MNFLRNLGGYPERNQRRKSLRNPGRIFGKFVERISEAFSETKITQGNPERISVGIVGNPIMIHPK